jgi:hypothetical protein
MKRERSDDYIDVGDTFVLCEELIGILRLLRMCIDTDMSGFCAIPLHYDSRGYDSKFVTVFDNTLVELYDTDGSTELVIEELLDIARFMLTIRRKYIGEYI